MTRMLEARAASRAQQAAACEGGGGPPSLAEPQHPPHHAQQQPLVRLAAQPHVQGGVLRGWRIKDMAAREMWRAGQQAETGGGRSCCPAAGTGRRPAEARGSSQAEETD